MSGRRIKRREFVDMVYNKIHEGRRHVNWEDIYWVNKAVMDCIVDIIENGDTLFVQGSFNIKPKLIKEHTVGNFGKSKVIIPEHYTAVLKPKGRIKEACEKLMEREENDSEESTEDED